MRTRIPKYHTYRTPDYVTLQWATDTVACDSSGGMVVYFGEELPLRKRATAEGFLFDIGDQQRKQCNYIAELRTLAPSTKYFYHIGEQNLIVDYIPKFWFVSAPDSTTLSHTPPHKFLIFGDLGSREPTNTSTVMPWTSREVQQGGVAMILQVGDFAYDMDSEGGELGRRFMNQIQNMSAFVPFMVLHGNHESSYNFAHYTEFFRNQPATQDSIVVTDNGPAPNNWFFSWNVGLVHFVVLSSELYFQYPDTNPLLREQWLWVQADLAAAAANRTAAPWIVVSGHRSIYCSSGSDCDDDATKLRAGIKQVRSTHHRSCSSFIVSLYSKADGTYLYGLEELLYKYKVDLWINGASPCLFFYVPHSNQPSPITK